LATSLAGRVSTAAAGASPIAAEAAATLLRHLEDGFAQARETPGACVRHVRIAGRPVRLELAGREMPDVLSRALAAEPMMGSAPEHSALRLRAWDADGVRPISEELWNALAPGPLGLVDALEPHGLRLVLDPAGGLVAGLDLARGEGLYWAAEPQRLAYWELAHPARLLFAAWAEAQGMHMCHAAAVGENGAGLLLVGRGGSGKSTSALACLRDGMSCAGDDYVLVEGIDAAHGAPHVHSLYASTLLHLEHAQRHAELMPHIDNASEIAARGDKAVMFADGSAGERMTGGFGLVAVAVPMLADARDTEARACSPGRALRALAPSTMLQLGADSAALRAMAALCRRLPCVELALGRDVTRIPDAVRRVLTAAGTEARG
jgi:hypothetical protein